MLNCYSYLILKGESQIIRGQIVRICKLALVCKTTESEVNKIIPIPTRKDSANISNIGCLCALTLSINSGQIIKVSWG